MERLCKKCPDKTCHATLPEGKLVIVEKPSKVGYWYWSSTKIEDCGLRKDEDGKKDNIRP
jgi:hypothetical protein